MPRGSFWTEEEGGLSVEFVVLFPFLMFLYAAMFVFWDTFLTRGVTVRATETIADMMSRETGSFDQNYLDGMHEVFDWLTSTESPTDLRMTAVGTMIDAEGDEEFRILWSHATGGAVPAIDAAELEASVPTPSVGEQLIVVETFYDFTPIFDVGIASQQLHYTVASRPRYVPQILWTDG